MKKQKQVNQPERLAGFTAILLFGLGIIQIVFGEFLAQSVALTANGIDCIGDGFVSLTVWTGLRFLRKPADERFHFGYYKMENLASIAAAIVMMILASYIVYRSYMQWLNPHPIQLPTTGIILALIATIAAVGLGIYKHVKGKKSMMGSVKLDAFNTIKDGVASGLTVIALILSSIGFTEADALVGFIIAGVIVSIGFTAIKESSYMLVDACDESCMLQSEVIRHLTKNIEDIIDAHLIRLRRSGPVLLGELEIIVSETMSVGRLYEIRMQIMEKAREEIPELERLTITAIPENKD